ncbi:XVIPCD domain-containing protein [Stenotrophomonas sp. YIM B06876]|uniref:XVIPCD domain-containing protein n=1 Tax=Stenotrophomonas sp. YIM B06876 TaxID=3060211 RepID=UPI00273840E6|nr:XVIPCD domain-containing protein [Stenotrophomonas sp. YIM B06876]
MSQDLTDKHRLDADGIVKDGVAHYQVSDRELNSYREANEALSGMHAPVFLTANRPNSRLYLAAFDGTGNDVTRDPHHPTNVAKLDASIKVLNEQGMGSVRSGYVAGPGTQAGWWGRTIDGAKGHTYDARLEEMYEKFINQAGAWKRENSDVDIQVASTGFSRGAEQAAGFTRLVHERGIQDPLGATYERDSQGQIKSVAYGNPPLVTPGQVAQAVALFDPVGTGQPVNEKDRRLPPSVISGMQITAADEHRVLFKSTRIIDPGMTGDGRFLGVIVAGAHSDIGGSYHRDGLGSRSGNLVVDYLNALSDKPLLEKQPEPDDPRLNVIHRSEEGMLLYRMGRRVDRLQPDGYVERLVPGRMANVADPFNAEPRDEVLNGRFARQPVVIGPVPANPSERLAPAPPPPRFGPDQPGHPDHGLHQQIRQGVERLDTAHGRRFDEVSERIAASLLPVAKQHGLTRVDHVLLSRHGTHAAAGGTLFVVQGKMDDPARKMAHVDTVAAAQTPVETSFNRLDQVNEQQAQQREQERALQEQRSHSPHAPAMGM